ncbi:MAG: hypothetical protein ACLUDG_07870, partial [Butyricicoccus sp.]
WGRCPQQASGEENHGGIFFPAGLCVLTQALLATNFRIETLAGQNSRFMIYYNKYFLRRPRDVRMFPLIHFHRHLR